MKSLWLEGKSASTIGERLGVTKNAVIGMVHRLKIRRAPQMTRSSLTKALLAKHPRPRKPPPPPPPPRRWITLFELKHDSCRYPRDGALGVEYCGAKSPFLSPWCAEHRALCYRRVLAAE